LCGECVTLRLVLDHEDNYLISAMPSSTIVVVKTLAKHVATRLGKQAFCVVFENDLERCWPRKEMARTKREKAIQSFAESQGWNAAILEGGFGQRAIFLRQEPKAADNEGASVIPA
jgi:hypothetical protein